MRRYRRITEISTRKIKYISSRKNGEINLSNKVVEKGPINKTTLRLCPRETIWKDALTNSFSVSFFNNIDTRSVTNFASLYKKEFKKRTNLRQCWLDDKSEKTKIRVGCNSTITMIKRKNNRVYISSSDSTVSAWCLETGTCLGIFQGHKGAVWCLALTEEYLITGSADTKVIIWSLSTFEPIKVITGHIATIRCIEIISKTIFVTGGADGMLRVWSIEGESLGFLFGHCATIRDIISLGKSRIASCSYDYTVRIWNIFTRREVFKLEGHRGRVYKLLFDGIRTIYSSSADTTVRIWDIETGECRGLLRRHTQIPCGLTVGRKKEEVVSASLDRKIYFWDMNKNKVDIKKEHTQGITLLESNGEFLLSGDSTCVKLWDIKEKKVIREILSSITEIWCSLVSEDLIVICYQKSSSTQMDIIKFRK
eukprot:GHVP01057264.1.p1 GENE.GHVP01057264.1~~GHVP01057264.1.p1  ORF type:complete len:476 (+),score=51.96 GHVP01057264.1:158-1429(+)